MCHFSKNSVLLNFQDFFTRAPRLDVGHAWHMLATARRQICLANVAKTLSGASKVHSRLLELQVLIVMTRSS